MTALLALALLTESPTHRIGPPVLYVIRGVVTKTSDSGPHEVGITVRWDKRDEWNYPPRVFFPGQSWAVRFRGCTGWPTALRPGDRIAMAWCPGECCFDLAIRVDRDLDLPLHFVVEIFVCEVMGGMGCNGLDPDTWVLIEGLGADRCKVRNWATEMLERRGESAWRELAHALGHRDPEVRDRAVRLAGPMVGVVAVQEPDDWEAK